ncbi:MAG: glutamate--tRNA ligase [Planctomycetes bacterium]|nr:glutamate--tRNA ligase [Planctomycetota bacterium]
MTDPVRVRFAPSPTGHLHIGGARTALFNWLFARRHGGRFLLRIEDTDRERSRSEYEEGILEALRWLGLDWDEGPFRQSERGGLYGRALARLVAAGAVYRCFCSEERLAAMRAEQEAAGRPPRYDRGCLGLAPRSAEARAAAGERHTWRFRVPEGETAVLDRVKGEVRVQNEEVDDFIVARSDGNPTYNFVVVADDLDLGITHVIRGDDHMTNTFKQVLLMEALGASQPEFCHVPLIFGMDRKKLSKRHGATAVVEYREAGYPAQALRNFLALLGWSPGDNREVLALDEMVQAFSLERLGRTPSVFDTDKLAWMCGVYIRERLPAEEVLARCLEFLTRSGLVEGEPTGERREWLARVVAAERDRLRTYGELPDRVRHLFGDQVGYDDGAVKNLRKDPEVPALLESYAHRIAEAPFAEAPALEAGARAFAAEHGLSFGKLVHPVRAALTGRTAGPGLFEVAVLLGRERSLARLRRAAGLLRSGELGGPAEREPGPMPMS